MASRLTPSQRFTLRNTLLTVLVGILGIVATILTAYFVNRTKHATIALRTWELLSLDSIASRLNTELGVSLAIRYGEDDLGKDARVYVLSLKNVGDESLVWKEQVPTDLVLRRPQNSKFFIVTADAPMFKETGVLIPTVRRLEDGSYSVACTHINPGEWLDLMVIADGRLPEVDFRPLSPVNVVRTTNLFVHPRYVFAKEALFGITTIPTFAAVVLLLFSRIRRTPLWLGLLRSGLLGMILGQFVLASMILSETLSLPQWPFVITSAMFWLCVFIADLYLQKRRTRNNAQAGGRGSGV